MHCQINMSTLLARATGRRSDTQLGALQSCRRNAKAGAGSPTCAVFGGDVRGQPDIFGPDQGGADSADSGLERTVITGRKQCHHPQLKHGCFCLGAFCVLLGSFGWGRHPKWAWYPMDPVS